MAPVSTLGLLAWATAALAVPHVGHNHQHLHARASTESSSSADSLSHVHMPSCWTTCLNKYSVTANDQLCSSSVGSSVKSCVDTACHNTPRAVKDYDTWVSNLCVSSVAGTGTGTGTAVSRSTTPITISSTPTVSPTVTSTSLSTTVCTETSTISYQTSSPCSEAGATSTSYSTYWTTEYSTYITTETITVGAEPTGYGSSTVSVAPVATSTASECSVVTVTTKIISYITVTAGASSSQVAPVQTSSSAPYTFGNSTSSVAAPTAPTAYSSSSTAAAIPTAYTSSSTEAAVPTAYTSAASSSTAAAEPAAYSSTSVAEAAVSIASAVSSVIASATSALDVSVVSLSAISTASSTAVPISAAGFSKRGLAYNDASDCDAFMTSSIMGWAYNWGSLPEGLDTSTVQYIPMLWSGSEPYTGYWSVNAETCIEDYNATYFFSFNEPDMTSQADMSPTDAAAAWKTYMEPYAGKVKLVAPAVTNGVGSGLGLDWLTQFIAACSDCTIDAVNRHWYDSAGNDAAYFKQQIEETWTATGLPVFVTEFAGIGDDDELVSFMDEVMDWMDAQDQVLGYSYYMVGDGYLNDGTGLSVLGDAYLA